MDGNGVILEEKREQLASLVMMVRSLDVFMPQERTFRARYASVASLLEAAKGELSDRGEVCSAADTGDIRVLDTSYRLKRVEEAINRVDVFSLQAREATFRPVFLYLDELTAVITLSLIHI